MTDNSLPATLSRLVARAGAAGKASVTLPFGMGITLDRTDPALHAVGIAGRRDYPTDRQCSPILKLLPVPDGRRAKYYFKDGWYVHEFFWTPSPADAVPPQPALPELAPQVDAPPSPDDSLDAQFARWLAKNPHILPAFLATAEALRDAGETRIGSKYIVEKMRQIQKTQTTGDKYRLNNNYTSRLGRLAIARRPDLAGLIECRELRS